VVRVSLSTWGKGKKRDFMRNRKRIPLEGGNSHFKKKQGGGSVVPSRTITDHRPNGGKNTTHGQDSSLINGPVKTKKKTVIGAEPDSRKEAKKES